MTAIAQPSRAVRRLSCCRCCGGPMPPGSVPREELYGALLITASPTFAKIVRRLARRPGRGVSSSDLIDCLWGGDPQGGPEWARGCIRKIIHRYRSTLTPLGWRLCSKGEGGRGISGYWLEALPC